MFDIKEELKNLPESPGVYLMHDVTGKIIYVGKAKVLKNRVRQYFQNNKNHSPKVKAMVSNISYFEYILTDTETEALVLECNLIKKYMPRYNILLKDDKQYPYIKVTLNDDYPKVLMCRSMANDGAKYFGPYMGMSTVNNTLDVVRKIFMPPTCKRKFPQDIGKGRPCLNYHIKKCFAPCTGKVSQKEYHAVFESICAFLKGDHKELTEKLTEQMLTASKNTEYEKAAALRDQIKAISDITEKQKITDTSGKHDRDVLALAGKNRKYISVFFVRDGKTVGREIYKIFDTEDLSDSEVLTSFIKQFYTGGVSLPREIVAETEISDKEIIEQMFSKLAGRKVIITVPQRGEKRDLVLMVKKNAENAAENEKIREIRESKSFVLSELSKLLGMEKEPERIESYDISNISGADSVGAMVVFEKGKPAKKKYRRFKIKTVEGADDYASTQEVIYRRFKRGLDEQTAIDNGTLLPANAKFLPYPDLILADGGKGHVKAICEMLEQMEIDIPVFGMVKDDKHRTRGMVSLEGEIKMQPYGALFNFITQLQDEVHRFAITYFRDLHSKESMKSELDNIEGVGKARRAKLTEHFGGIDKIKTADIEELQKVVDRKTAEAVWNYFRKND